MATQVPPKKNTAFRFFVSLTSQSQGNTFQASPTLAAGDVKVSIDDGASFANLTTLPAVVAGSTKTVQVDLSASEMNADKIIVLFSDAAGAEWKDKLITIFPSTKQIDDLATQTSVDTIDDFLDTEVAAIKAKTDNLPADPADASDISASFSSLNTKVDTIDDFLDTEIAALTTELAKVPKSDSNVTWNATALASIQSEANDALVANNLDHLLLSAVDTDFATTVHLNSVIGHLADNGTTATYDRTTDSLEVLGSATTPPTAAAIADAVWDEATTGHTTSGTFGEQLKTDVDSILSEMSKVPKSDSNITWNSSAVSQIYNTVQSVVVANNLDHLLVSAVDTDFATTVHLNSVIGHIVDNGTSASYDRTTDSLEAARDNIGTNGAALTSSDDAVLAAIAALNNLSAAQVNTECDTALSDIGATSARMGYLDELAAANLPADIDQIKADLPQRFTKNTALAGFTFVMYSSTDHSTPLTGATVTAQRSLDGAAFANCANAVSEISAGAYKIDLAAGDLNANVVLLKLSATGADTQFQTIITQPT